MKISSDLPKLWAQKIKEAGMTKNQAKKVIDASSKTIEEAQKFIEAPNRNTETNGRLTDLLKKINIF